MVELFSVFVLAKPLVSIQDLFYVYQFKKYCDKGSVACYTQKLSEIILVLQGRWCVLQMLELNISCAGK